MPQEDRDKGGKRQKETGRDAEGKIERQRESQRTENGNRGAESETHAGKDTDKAGRKEKDPPATEALKDQEIKKDTESEDEYGDKERRLSQNVGTEGCPGVPKQSSGLWKRDFQPHAGWVTHTLGCA